MEIINTSMSEMGWFSMLWKACKYKSKFIKSRRATLAGKIRIFESKITHHKTQKWYTEPFLTKRIDEVKKKIAK